MPLSDLFKSKEELENEQKRQQKREMRDANRSVERIQADLDRQAKDLEAQIKAAAAKNDTATAKTLAKQLIRVREERNRAINAKSKINTISNQSSMMQTNNKLAQVMANSAAAMSKVNQQLQPDQIAKQLGAFQAETTKMDMVGGAFEDMFDELFEGEDEEADAIMNQVLEEIALDTGSKLAVLPTTSKAALPDSQQVGGKTQDKVQIPKSAGHH